MSTLNTLYTSDQIYKTDFNPKNYSLIIGLVKAVNETLQSLKYTCSLHFLVKSIKEDNQCMKIQSSAVMSVIGNKFGSTSACLCLPYFCTIIYSLCISYGSNSTRK